MVKNGNFHIAYWCPVVKIGNFTLLQMSSDEEWPFPLLLTSSSQEWQFHVATDI